MGNSVVATGTGIESTDGMRRTVFFEQILTGLFKPLAIVYHHLSEM